MTALPVPTAVVCHDAGAANIILHGLDAQQPSVQAYMQGPAERLWRDRFGNIGLVKSLDAALDGAALVITGTGWASDLEHRARVAARERGQRSAAVIDHWVNYAARFERDGQKQLPDQIWVTDDDALRLAQSVFPGHDIQLQPNPYLAAQVRAIGPTPDPLQNRTVLVVLEPVRNDWGRGVPGEFQALDHLVALAHRAGLSAPLQLRLRPHPSDPAGKYDAWIVAQQGHDVALDDAASLPEALSRVAWVAGCESMAMVVALAAGRRVICTLPPWAPPCRLPQRGLLHLK